MRCLFLLIGYDCLEAHGEEMVLISLCGIAAVASAVDAGST